MERDNPCNHTNMYTVLMIRKCFRVLTILSLFLFFPLVNRKISLGCHACLFGGGLKIQGQLLCYEQVSILITFL